MKATKEKVLLLTGGNGFIGQAMIAELKAEDSAFKDYVIRVFDIHSSSKNEDVVYFSGDIRKYGDLLPAIEGCELVIHAAAIVDWGTQTPAYVMDVNFKGTENVIAASKEMKVKALVYTSTLDVVFNGEPLIDIDEAQPYPAHPHNAYCRSKGLAEQAVIAANSNDLRTAVIRPCDVYGEGDRYHIESLTEMAEKGFYVKLGDGSSRCQHVYVGNVANAHLQLAENLLKEHSPTPGNIYFITDSSPSNFFTFFTHILEEAGYKLWPKNLWLPKSLAMFIAGISEFIAVLWRPIRHYNPKFSRFAVRYTCTDFTFSSAKAARDFNFQPKYSHQLALERTIAYYKR